MSERERENWFVRVCECALFYRSSKRKEIFLSHSGIDKSFTTFLRDELENRHQRVFIDVDRESLPKGKRFPDNILAAVRGCKIAVFVLSQSFAERKWPMIELVVALNEYNKKESPLLLPLFFKLSPNEIDTIIDNEQTIKLWGKWSRSKSVPVGVQLGAQKCKRALQSLSRHNGLALSGGNEYDFIKIVADEICRQITPDVWNIEDMQGQEELTQGIRQCYGQCTGDETEVLGLWGWKDSGKTSLSNALCHLFYQEHLGNVHCAELRVDSKSILPLLKDILQSLTGADSRLLESITTIPSAIQTFNNRIQRRTFFLAIDNIPADNDCQKGLKDLLVAITRSGTSGGRKILITARSSDILTKFLNECGCSADKMIEVPKAGKGALCEILIRFATKSSKSMNSFDGAQKNAIQTLVDEKSWSCGLAKTIGLLISGWPDKKVIENPCLWKSVYDKYCSEQKDDAFFQAVHSVVGAVFNDYWKAQQALLFLVDAALYEVSMGLTLKATWRWLGIVHGVPQKLMKKKFKEMKEHRLVDWKKEEEEDDEELPELRDVFSAWPRFDFSKFAKVQVRSNPSKWRWFYYDGLKREQRVLIDKNQEVKLEKVEKIAVFNSNATFVEEVVNLKRCVRVIAFMMARSSSVQVVGLGSMTLLQALEIEDCSKLEWIDGMENGDKLVRLYLNFVPNWPQPTGTVLQLGHFKNLRSVRLRETGMVEPPVLNGCVNLQELYIENNSKLKRLPDFVNSDPRGFSCLTNVSFADNPLITSLPDLRPLAPSLAELSLRNCAALTSNFITVGSLTCLRRINISGCTQLRSPAPNLSHLYLDEESKKIYDALIIKAPSPDQQPASSQRQQEAQSPPRPQPQPPAPPQQPPDQQPPRSQLSRIKNKLKSYPFP